MASPPATPLSSSTVAAARKAASGRIVTSGVLDYMRGVLPRETLLELYQEETRGRFVCAAVLQQLSAAAQQVVVRLSFSGGAFPLTVLKIWIKGNYDPILKELEQWAILVTQDSADNGSMVRLTDQFLLGYQKCMKSTDATPWKAIPSDQAANKVLEYQRQQQKELQATQKSSRRSSPPKDLRPTNVTTEDLERYQQSVWDAVLHFLVGTVGTTEPPPAVVHFLLETGLMQVDPDDPSTDPNNAPLVITEKGYDFMLQDNHQQVWHFVVQYLHVVSSKANTPEKKAKMVREALLLLICLSFGRVGEAYESSSLSSKKGRSMLRDLAHFGLIYVQPVGEQDYIFHPTRVALQLLGLGDATGNGSRNDPSSAARSGSAGSMWSLSSKALEEALAHPQPRDSAHLAIIVQTNFQVCAYTTSELHVSMLGLFCDVTTIRRLPNMVFMNLSRDSVKSAFALGIRARQILRFLEKHAHPRLRTQMYQNAGSSSPVPSNVVDQIWLWDRERSRVKFTEVYQHQCLMEGEFQVVQKYTMDHGAHVWSSEARQQIMVDYQHAERIQALVRQWRARSAARQQHG